MLDSVDKIRDAVRAEGVEGVGGGDLLTEVRSHLLRPIGTLPKSLLFRLSWEEDRKGVQAVTSLVTLIKALPARARLAPFSSGEDTWL
jgi:hypothetical protein